jgi:HAD superfamily hydrolase (TIGR01450 family)
MSVVLSNVRHVALDLDGTVYTDETLFDAVKPFLATLKRQGIGYTFLTNNSSRGKAEYVERLRSMGIDVQPEEIYTSGDATIEYLREEWPDIRRLFVLGTPSLADQFAGEGYGLCENSPADVPELVIVGFDSGLAYGRLCRAAYWISRGVPYAATHLDRVCPTNEPTVLVDCGSMVAALECATGCKPIAALGKPNRRMLRGILGRYALAPAELAMVGDRLYTDMLMAREAGVVGVLVLTGETGQDQVVRSDIRPDLVVRDLEELGRLFPMRRGNSDGGSPCCGDRPPKTRASTE